MKKRLLLICLLMLLPALALAARAEGAQPSFTVNGSATSASVEFNEAPSIRIHAPGATAVRVLAERLYQDDDPKHWEQYFDRDRVLPLLEENGWRMFDRGTWRITAAYTTEDYPDGTDIAEAELNWIPIGDGVTVQVADWVARLNAPAAALSQSAVERGEPLTVTVSSFQHKDEWYWIELEKRSGENDWEFIEHIDTSIAEGRESSFLYSTLALEPGDYRFWLRCEAVRYEDNGTYLPFTVGENTAPLPAAQLLLSSSTGLTSQDVRLYAYAPDADYMRVDVRWDGDPNWRDSRDGGGEANSWSWGTSDRGTYTFTLGVWKGEEAFEADPVTLTIAAPYGDLADPTGNGLPGLLPVNTDAACSFNGVANAGWYVVELNGPDMNGDWRQLARFDRQASAVSFNSLSFPGDLFSVPGIYELHVAAVNTGWNGGHLHHRFLAAEPAQQTLTLTVNGGTHDIDDWLTEKDFHVDVDLPMNATAVRVMNGHEWETWDAEDFYGADWNWSRGSYVIVAQATADEPVWRDEDFDWGSFHWDDLDWSMISNAVRLNVTAPNGPLDAVTLTVPETVVRGAWLPVNVAEVPNAAQYFLYVHQRNENGFEGERLFQALCREAGEILVPTARLLPGESYCVRVSAEAEGYESSSAEKTFTVNGAETAGHVRVSATETLTQVTLTYSVYEPGAESLRLLLDNDWFDEQDGEAMTGRIAFFEPGDFELRAIAPDGEGWRDVGEPVVVHVTAPYGGREVEIDAPASVSASGTAQFTVTWKHGGVDYIQETALYDRDWNEYPLETVSITEGETETTGVFRVRGEDLEPGKVYTIESRLRPGQPGTLNTRASAEIAVVSGSTRGSVSVSRDELLRCEEATITVDVPGATALWLYRGDGLWDGFVGSHAEGTWPFFQTGDNRVFARYTTETVADPENVDFGALNWTGYTPAATVRVSAVGRLAQPDYTLESEIVTRGEPFRFTINSLQGLDEWYIAYLQDDEGNDLTEHVFWDEDNRLRVDTTAVESGLYWLLLHGDAVGYESCDVRRFVAIEEADGLVVSLPDSSVLTQARPAVSAYAPGAEQIELVVTDPSGAFPARTWLRDGDQLREDIVFSAWEGSRHVVVTATYADREPDVYEADVQIVAPYGDLGAKLYMTSAWTEGQDLAFRVDAGEAEFIAVDVIDLETEACVYSDPDVNFDDWHYDLPAGLFTPGHACGIDIYSAKEGYNADETLIRVVALPADPDTLTLPAALTEISEEAFMGTAAEQIVIPATVRSVAARAFADCLNLIAVEIADGATGICADAFAGSGPFVIYGAPGSAAEAWAAGVEQATFIYVE